MAVGRTSPIRVVFCFSVLAAILYVASVFGRPYYRYHVLKSELVQISILTAQPVDKLREMALQIIDRQRIPVRDEDLRIYKNRFDDIGIHARWTDDVYMFGRYVTTLYFDVDVGAAVR